MITTLSSSVKSIPTRARPGMSSIEKLLIRGIRSFDPDSAAVIEFYSPVTLIVGHNGAGKTTVIECLKYATTGDLPPNAKGGAFLHDPKLCGESEVKGQVKLKFRNVKGQVLVVTRSLQSSLKRGGKIEQKTLEGVLMTNDPITGEQISISSRCAELDAEIPVQLGVSKSVLDDVIFCHQEDSQWPLSEPSVLKKRFDDLFAATRYTKALEALRASRKELLNELKLEQQKLDYLKADSEKAFKLQATINLTEKHTEECRLKIHDYNKEIEQVNKGLDELRDELATIGSKFNELERLENELSIIQASFTELQSLIGAELTDSNEMIHSELEQFTRFINNHQQEIDTLEDSRLKMSNTLQSRQQFLNTLLAEKGTIMALVDESKRKEAMLVRSLESICVTFEMSDYRLAVDHDSINILKDHIQSSIIELEKAKSDHNRLVQCSHEQINALTSKRSLQEEVKRMKKKTIDAQRQLLIDTIRKLEDLESSESQVEDLKQRLGEEELAFIKANDLLASGDYENRLLDCENKKALVEEKIKKANQGIAEQSELAEIRAKHELKLTEKAKKLDIQNKILVEIKPDLQSLDIEEENTTELDKEMERRLRAKEKELKEFQERIDQFTASHAMLSSKRDHITRMIQERERELQAKTAIVKSVIGNEDHEMLLEECEASYKTLLTESLDSSSFARFAQSIQSSHSCPVCERTFNNLTDEKMTLKRLQDKSSASNQHELCKVEKRLAELRKLKPICEDVDKIKLFELVELHKEQAKLAEELERSSLDIQEIKSDHSKIVLEEKRLQLLKRRADEFVRMEREVKVLNDDCRFIERDLNLSDSIGISQLKLMLITHEDQLRLIAQEQSTVGKEYKQRLTEVQSRSSRFRDLKEELMQLLLRQGEKSSLLKAREGIEESLKAIENEINKIDADLLQLSRDIDALQSQWSESIAKSQMALQKKECEHEEKRIQMSAFACLFEEYLALGNPLDRLQTVDKQLSTANQEIQEIHGTMANIDKQLLSIKQGASETINRERLLKDNLKIRELRAKLTFKECELATLQSCLQGLNKHSIISELNRCQLTQSDLMGQRSGLTGELRQLEEQHSRLTKELLSDYPNIESKFKEQCIKVEASQLAASDLDRYAKALDQAIMRYHAAKMDEVNRSLRDLWSSVYTGTDIDAVEIRADQEGGGTTTTTGHRSYNYRVVMIKGNVELDMRGRSSAGQRVLTSLLIRLALADTFASHCGVLALDEPTTNLDRDNIAALAEALADLIRSRREQHNFQLIVITHDEEFVEALARHECAENYWRISKDSKQHSMIERQSLNSF